MHYIYRHSRSVCPPRSDRNGFRLLRPGGVLVYSTCSLMQAQNEDVVQHLLDNEPAATMDVVDIGTPIGDVRDERSDLEGASGGGGGPTGKEGTEGRGGGGDCVKGAQGPGGVRRLPCRWGRLPGTLVFEPRSGTSGLFVARVRKGGP